MTKRKIIVLFIIFCLGLFLVMTSKINASSRIKSPDYWCAYHVYDAEAVTIYKGTALCSSCLEKAKLRSGY